MPRSTLCTVRGEVMQKHCKTCGILFDTKPSHYDIKTYCSKSCMAEDYRQRMAGENNPNWKGGDRKECVHCGTVFHDRGVRRYCTLECYNASEERRENSRRANDKRRRSPGKCKECGVEIDYRRKMCDDCKPGEARVGQCLSCGEEVGSRYDVKFCKECRNQGLHKKEIFSICSSCGVKIEGVPNRKYCTDCLTQVWRARRGMARRVDANQAEIVEALIAAGCSVMDASQMGGGFPDLMVGKNGKTYLIEVKNPEYKSKLNAKQQEFFDAWHGQADIAYTVEEALKIVGMM